MEPILLGLATRMVTPGLPDRATVLFSLGTSVAFTALVGWFASRLASERLRQRLAALTEANPVAGVH